MNELLNHIGVKGSTLIAGLLGGILALSMMPKLTFRKAVTAVVGGVACAAYVTPLVAEWMDLASRNVENGLAFGLGIAGMNMLGGVFKLSERWRDNPTLDPDELRKLGEKDE